MLCCPSSAEDAQQVAQYLRTCIAPGGDFTYHLGLSCSPDDQSITWQSGAPYRWRQWLTAASEAHFLSTGCACLVCSMVNLEDARWAVRSSKAKLTVLLEWAT